LCIFIDHTPGDRLTSLTIRNLGFSDASELFVFIAAVTAGLVYSRRSDSSLTDASRRMVRRVGQLYVTHIVLLGLVAVLAYWLTLALNDAQFINGLNVRPLLQQPQEMIPRVLALAIQPTFMNILPLYIVLLIPLPLVLRVVWWRPVAALALSFVIYVAARAGQGVVPTPFGMAWQFNPLAWQFLFVIGVAIGASSARGSLRVPRSPLFLALSAGYLLVAFWLGTEAWTFDGSTLPFPPLARSLLFPVMDRVNLSPWRLAHLLALAYLVTSVIRADSPIFRWRVSKALSLCGRHSLPLFAAGVLLSIAGWAVFVRFGTSNSAQVFVNAVGFAVLLLLAWLLDRRSIGRHKGSRHDARPPLPVKA
jgi:hypothetical protein